MQIQNFQQKAWTDLFTRVINILAEDAAFTCTTSENGAGDFVKISFKIPEESKQTFLDSATVSNQRMSSFATLKTQVTLQYRGVKETQTIDLIDLPRLANGGLLINGCRWSLVNTTHPASGWYVESSKKKHGALQLNLHRGAGVVISIQPDKVDKKLKPDEYTYVVKIKTRADSEYTMSLPEFLVAVACDASITCKTVAEDSGLDDCTSFTNTFIKGMKKDDERLEELCTRLIRHLRNKSSQYIPLSATADLKSMLDNNYLNIGEEKIPRFKRFTSFCRAVGTVLDESVNIETRNGGRYLAVNRKQDNPFALVDDTYRKGTIITESIAHDLDRVQDLYELNVVTTSGDTQQHFTLKRMPELTSGITFEEICCALRVFDQVLHGIGTPDDIDDMCNKVMCSIREEFSRYIEQAFKNCSNEIRKCIRNSLARSQSNANPVHAVMLDFASGTKYKTDAATISRKIVGSSCYQQVDETNSLASFDQSYRITSTASNVTHKARDIHPLQYGRICPYTTSESKQVGLNLDMTLGCGIDSYGFCTTPVYELHPVDDADSRIGDLIQLSAVDEFTAVIAPATADISGSLEDTIDDCRVNGDFRAMPLREVTHIMANNLQTVGPLIASVPAQNMDAGKRSVMSVSAQRQALIPWRCERPNVTTAIDAVCDIGIQRARTIVETYIYTNKDATLDYETSGKLPTRLVVIDSGHSETNGDFIVKFKFLLNGHYYDFQINNKPPAATMKGSLKYVRFNIPRIANMEQYFEMDDIVFYNSDVDMSNDVQLSTGADDHLNFGGAMKSVPTDELKGHGVAIGANVNVMFKSMNGYTYEDSIVVNEDFLAKQGLAIIKTRTLSYNLAENVHIAEDYSCGHMMQGLPLNGSYVQPGQEILAVVIHKEGKEPTTTLYPLSVGTQGYVLSHEITTNHKTKCKTVMIHLGEVLPIGVGDKLTGLHGNKGVVGRIMKSSEMPFTEDGTVPDIILNPLGILARLNEGQIFEFNLGAVSRKTGKIEVLEPFTSKINIMELLKRNEEFGLVEQDVYSGTTGVKLDKKAFIGNMYFLRVEHTSTSKYNATGDCREYISNRTNQPMRCSGGAQRISEMGTWCLLSMNANKLLQSLFSVQSDSAEKSKFDKQLALGTDTSNISIANGNLDAVRAYFYMLGFDIDIFKPGDAIDEVSTGIRFLTRDEMNRRAKKDNGAIGLVDVSPRTKASEALHDYELFGKGTALEYKSLTKLYAKLPFNTELIMPALLHTNSLTHLIRAIVVKKGTDDCEVQYRSLDKRIMNSLIHCRASVDAKKFREGYILVGWSRRIAKAPERLAKLEQIGISIPADVVDLRVPILIKVTTADSIPVMIKQAKHLVDITETKCTGMGAVVEIFKKYSLYTSLFDTDFEDVVNVINDNSTEAIEAEVIEPLLDDTLAADIISDNDVQNSKDVDELVNTRLALDATEDVMSDDDVDAFKAENDSDDTELNNLDSADIEKEIPSFRGIAMMLVSYPNEDGQGRILANFVMDGMLIPPAKFRPQIASDPKKSSPIDVCLNSIYDCIKQSLANTDQSLNADKLYDVLRVQSITGTNKKAPSLISQIKDHKSGTSLLRDTNLSKRVTYSARSVISIGRDLQFGECGIPVCMLTTIFMERLINMYMDASRISTSLLQNATRDKTIMRRALTCLANKNIVGFRHIFSETHNLSHISSIKFNMCYSQLVEDLRDLLQSQPAILNREPSLHKFSLQGCKVIPVDSYTLLLHPLNCHGFNADFDGDQMAAILPMHQSGRDDTNSKVMTRNNLIDPKDCSGIISLNQDMILGLYYATIHKDNIRDFAGYYNNISLADIKKFYSLPVHNENSFTAPKGHSFGVAEQIASDLFAGIIKIHDICCVMYDSRIYIAEAGRFIVNAALPGGMGFTNTKLSADVESLDDNAIMKHCTVYQLYVSSVLTKKTINPVINACINYFMKYGLDTDEYGDHLADVYNRLMHIGFIIADLSGITLSLYDFAKLPVKHQISSLQADAKNNVQVLNKWYDLGFCTEQEHTAATNKIWSDTVTNCKNEIGKKFMTAEANALDPRDFDRNSNIFMIIDSGARGDVNQLLEMAGMIGVVHNSANQQLKNPILASYMDGLSPMDFASNACTARRQITATQLTTADSGAETRDLIYLAEHLHIRSDNWCCKDEPSDNPNNVMLRIPCIYDATLTPIDEIKWFSILDTHRFDKLSKNMQQMESAIEIVKTKDMLTQVLHSYEASGIGNKPFFLLSDAERLLYTDYTAYSSRTDIPYEYFMSRLSSKTSDIDPVAMAAICYQQYCYVVLTRSEIGENGELIHEPIAYGIRMFKLKLSALTRDLLKWRIAKADDIENNPLVGYNNTLYVQNEDIVDDAIDPKVLRYSNISAADNRFFDVVLDDEAINTLELNVVREVPIYSMINCTSTEGICRKCFGVAYDTFKLPRPNDLIGYSGIQAIANPMTQLILDSHKLGYSGEEGAISKIQRVTSQRHLAEPMTTDTLKRILESAHKEDSSVNETGLFVDIPFFGFTIGTKAVVALDPVDQGMFEVTVFDLWNDKDNIQILRSSTVCKMNVLCVRPTVINNRILSRFDSEDDILSTLNNSQFSRGTIITDIKDYDKYMGCAYDFTGQKCNKPLMGVLASNTRFEYWQTLCKCFTNDTILSRNFETFARALTEFGVAEATDLNKGIIKGYTYDTSLLDASSIPYTPVIERRTSARTLAGKVYTDIAYGNPLAHIMYHAVNGTVENKDTFIGRELLGADENVATRVKEFAWKSNTKMSTNAEVVMTSIEMEASTPPIVISQDNANPATASESSDVHYTSIFKK